MHATDFLLLDQNGQPHRLHDYADSWLVLYFYPKDQTPGCTTEACSFRDGRAVLAELGLSVVGVSKDSVESHRKFAEKEQLNFTLLSDPTHQTIKAYGAWGVFGTKRSTVLINPAGDIVKRYDGVDPGTHVGEIIKDFRALQA